MKLYGFIFFGKEKFQGIKYTFALQNFASALQDGLSVEAAIQKVKDARSPIGGQQSSDHWAEVAKKLGL